MIVPTPVVVNVTINVIPDTAAIRAGVVSALQDLFFREAVPGGSIPHDHMVEVISGVTGETNHTISSPVITSGASFVAGAYNQMLVLGTVTFV